jgi:hypothetical protein
LLHNNIRNTAHYDTVSEETARVFKVTQRHVYEVLTQPDQTTNQKWVQREHESTLVAVVNNDMDIISVQIDGSNLEIFSEAQLDGYITLLNQIKDSGVLRDANNGD